MTFHKQTVLDMLQVIGEDPSPYDLCKGALCGMLDNGGTEFTMYLDFAHSRSDFECTHFPLKTEYNQPIGVALWRGLNFNLNTCKDVALGTRTPTMFGAQAGALDALPDYERTQAVDYLVKIYSNADLYSASTTSADTLFRCVVGPG